MGKSPSVAMAALVSPSRESIAGLETFTRSKYFRTARAQVLKNGKARARHGNEEIDGVQSDTSYRTSTDPDTDRKRKKSSLRHKIKSSILQRRSRSSTPSSSEDSRQSSGDHSKSRLRNLLSRRSKTPDNVIEDTPTRPISSKVRRSGITTVKASEGGLLSDYQPPLSPIKGTPTHKTRPHLPVDEVDSGLGRMGTTDQALVTIEQTSLLISEQEQSSSLISEQEQSSSLISEQKQSSSLISEQPLEGEPVLVSKNKAVTLARRGTITGM